MGKVTFYLDENIANAVATGLRHREIDVITTVDVGHKGWSDEAQLKFAFQEQRIIVTQDDDLLKLASQSKKTRRNCLL